MKLISKEFSRETYRQLNIDQLLVTVELDNKQYCITIDNEDNHSQEQYSFSTSKYHNDDIDSNILEQFENSDFYNELCEFAESEAIDCDDKLEDEIEKELESNFYEYKADRNYYNSKKLTIFKHNEKSEFVLRVEDVSNHFYQQSFYRIDCDDFEEEDNEVSLRDWYDYDCTNEIVEL